MVVDVGGVVSGGPPGGRGNAKTRELTRGRKGRVRRRRRYVACMAGCGREIF